MTKNSMHDPTLKHNSVRFSVGQVVFVFVKERSRLLPARVAEEVVKRTIDGEHVSYSIQFSTQEPNDALVSMDSLKDEVFSTAEDAGRILTERMVASIKRLVDVAVQKAGELFPDSLDELTRPSIVSSEQSVAQSGDDQLVELDDGSKVKIRVKK